MTLFGGDDDTARNTTFAGADDDRILQQALDYLDSESLEKARQKHSMLSCLHIRDKISSLKGQVDSISRQFTMQNRELHKRTASWKRWMQLRQQGMNMKNS